MTSILRTGLLVVLAGGLAMLAACGPAADFASDAEAEILTEEERKLMERLARWRSMLDAPEAREAAAEPTDLDDRDEIVLALEIVIAQDLARLRKCRERRAELAAKR